MQKPRRARIIFIFSLVLALLLAGGTGFVLGQNYSKTNQSNTVAGADFDLFWQAYDRLKENYLGEIDPQKYLYGAISGAYQSLGDPYTTFFSPQLTKEFEQELTGQLEGIGLKLGILEGLPTVIAPIDDSPAQIAGIKTKDKVLKVDDFLTEGQPLDLIVSKIRGAAGTKVKLLIQPANSNETKEYELTRQKIEIKTVEIEYRGKTAILSLSEFGTETNGDFEKAYQDASQKGVENLILDLRGNPGGLLDSAINISEYFLKKGQVIVIEQAKAERLETRVETERGWQSVNLIVLVDQGSASASEIVAGAIKDNKRGKLIGEKTFGKGVVQQFLQLSGGSSAKITVSKWLTPSGQDIDKNGISPDIEAKSAENQNFDENDPVINRALEEF